MLTYKARDLVNYTRQEIWSLPRDRKFLVEFDDGVLATTAVDTIISWYYWCFWRRWPDAPLLLSHHLGGKDLTKKVQLQLLSRCLYSNFLHHRKTGGRTSIEEYWADGYNAVNLMYNHLSNDGEESVPTVSAADFVNVVNHPEIRAINAQMRPTPGSIKAGHAKIQKILRTDEAMDNNRIAIGIRNGLQSPGQVNQVVSALGYRTHKNSQLFPRPVLSSFTEGIVSLADSLMESQSAGKAIQATKIPLQDTQYYNREMQLETCAVAWIDQEFDCGTKETVPFAVRSTRDLEDLWGMWMVREDGSLAMLEPTDEMEREVVGKTIRLRSALTCAHPDEQSICSCCFGEIFWSIPFDSNIGHVSVVEICEKISQIVLSTKHLDASATVEPFDIRPADAQFIELGEQDNLLVLKPWVLKRYPVMRFQIEEAANLAVLDQVEEIRSLAPENVSAFTYVMMYSPKDRSSVPVCVSMGRRLGSFTHEFLEYLRDTRWVMANELQYEVSLENWDFTKPMFRMPMKHRDMLEYKKEVEKYIKASSPYDERTYRPVTNEEMGQILMGLHDLISSKLQINVTHMAVVLYSTMIRSSAAGDFRLPKPGTGREFASYNHLLEQRSLAPAMAYQSQSKVIMNTDSYMNELRHSSPLDDILRSGPIKPHFPMP